MPDDFAAAWARLDAEPWLTAALARIPRMEPWIRRQQLAVAAIAAPTGGEGMRAEWMLAQFTALGLEAGLDAVGNVLARMPARSRGGANRRQILITAHMDTAFPPGTAMTPQPEGRIWRGPGIGDNAAGLAALLALARLTAEAQLDPRHWPFRFAANVGEEGEGDLRGMRHLFSGAEAGQIAHTLVLDGPGQGTTTRALGSRRFQVEITGPGGHSWADAGAASAIHALARVAERLLRRARNELGVAACNIGQISGGGAINAVAPAASMKVDLRAAEASRLEQLAEELRAAVEEGVAEENRQARSGAVTARLESLGERPAGALPRAAPLRAALEQVEERLGMTHADTLASTDANVPLALGRSAVRLGAGGSGGGAHSMQEWFDPAGRAPALRRALLLMALLAEAGI